MTFFVIVLFDFYTFLLFRSNRVYSYKQHSFHRVGVVKGFDHGVVSVIGVTTDDGAWHSIEITFKSNTTSAEATLCVDSICTEDTTTEGIPSIEISPYVYVGGVPQYIKDRWAPRAVYKATLFYDSSYLTSYSIS